ncbi:MAG: metalloendopeptidase-like rane protein [Eubacterium sp.]|nr:metalloendopeptidase-like rane protein [Eubacterium sp.]
MDEMIVRPKYSRQTSTARRKKRPNGTDMMSTIFAAKLLVVVVFLSVFALCKAADTPATAFFISKVKLITTDNFDANKYLLSAANTLGIKLPDIKAITQPITGQTTGPDNESDEDIQTIAQPDNTGKTNGSGTQSNSNINENNQNGTTQDGTTQNDSAQKGTAIDSMQQQKTDTETGAETGSSSISDNISAITEVPVLEEKDIKTLADKYSFIYPIKGDISSAFGIRTDPLSGKTEFHSGIDIKANMGTSIKSALEGEVVEVGSSPEYDNYVKVKHNDGIYTVYAHCSILVAQKGQKVKQGDVVAKVGDSEGLSGAYLHFEVWKDDKAVDPEKLLNLLNQ